YRLSVLPLKIPSLNERKEDIIPLIESLKNELNAQFELSKKALEVFFEHNWEGNVRELRNYIEYFSNLDKDIIKIEDFPFTLLENTKDDYILNDREKEILSDFKEKIEMKIDDYNFILKELKRRYENGIRAGRRSLANTAQENNIFLSEMEVRKMLKRLGEFNFVEIGKGRQGTKLTSLGIKISDYLEKRY
ncbi:MAG: sigma-54 interaction domain-containing protein, partial [Bacillota bacterium]